MSAVLEDIAANVKDAEFGGAGVGAAFGVSARAFPPTWRDGS
jgi:hypothetical protein